MIDALAAPLDVALFENADWRVLADGLMHRETAYFIPREGLDRRRDADLWEWPLHCAEKRWCAPRPFREAFLAAVELFDLPRDEALAQSFAVGFGLRMGQGGTPATDGFLTLGDLVRPKPVLRKRTAGSEARSSARRGGPPAVAPQKEAGLGRVALS